MIALSSRRDGRKFSSYNIINFAHDESRTP